MYERNGRAAPPRAIISAEGRNWRGWVTEGDQVSDKHKKTEKHRSLGREAGAKPPKPKMGGGGHKLPLAPGKGGRQTLEGGKDGQRANVLTVWR